MAVAPRVGIPAAAHSRQSRTNDARKQGWIRWGLICHSLSATHRQSNIDHPPLRQRIHHQGTRPLSRISYRPEIDGLRAIAVLSVVLYHAGIGPQAGFVGVDVFFVISGYLITLLLVQESSATGRIDLLAFYARRARRILPALIVVLLVTVCASMILLSRFGEQRDLARSAAASLLFVANFYFQDIGRGYFDPVVDRLPLLHLWSLAVEEQFYLIWPLGLMLLLRFFSRLLPWAIAVLTLASFASAETLLLANAGAAFYQMPARLWELAVGGLIASGAADHLRDRRVYASAGMVALLAATVFPLDHFPGVGALPAVAGTAMVLFAIHGSGQLGFAGACLATRPVVFIGLISYSLYLWHWPLLALDRATRVGPSPWSTRVLLVAVSLLLAWLSFRFVERPLRRADARVTNSSLVTASVVLLASMAFLVLTLSDALHQVAPSDDLASRTSRDMPHNRVACHYRGDESLELFPKPDCNSVPKGPVKVAIWGDSIALSWQPLAWTIAQRDGVAATSYTRDACAPLLDFDNGKRHEEERRCREFNSLAFGKISDLDTLILAASWPRNTADRNFQVRFEASIERYASRVGKILLVGPTPMLRDAAPRCIEAGNLAACAISRREFEAHAGAARKLLIAAAAKYANVEYLETVEFFCDAVDCPVLKDGYSLYWDANHVSSTAARDFATRYLKRK